MNHFCVPSFVVVAITYGQMLIFQHRNSQTPYFMYSDGYFSMEKCDGRMKMWPKSKSNPQSNFKLLLLIHQQCSYIQCDKTITVTYNDWKRNRPKIVFALNANTTIRGETESESEKNPFGVFQRTTSPGFKYILHIVCMYVCVCHRFNSMANWKCWISNTTEWQTKSGDDDNEEEREIERNLIHVQ